MEIKRLVFAAGKKDRSWFWWGINIGVLIAIGVWWWLDRQSKANSTVKVQPLVLPPDDDEFEAPGEQEATSRVVEAVVEEPDELQMIEGIGPRSAQTLLEAGILTFKTLAAMDPEAIHSVLREAGVRVPYPETWPEQATLAAAGNWDALKELQGSLKGGRRV
jgi:predicted flap endonuclease-1-like 5' DNA nuclease